jgi:hypothetical protein
MYVVVKCIHFWAQYIYIYSTRTCEAVTIKKKCHFILNAPACTLSGCFQFYFIFLFFLFCGWIKENATCFMAGELMP